MNFSELIDPETDRIAAHAFESVRHFTHFGWFANASGLTVELSQFSSAVVGLLRMSRELRISHGP